VTGQFAFQNIEDLKNLVTLLEVANCHGRVINRGAVFLRREGRRNPGIHSSIR